MTRRLLPVQLERSWIMLEASWVREVLGAERWTSIPRATPTMPGVLAWRGRAIPVIDLARALGMEPSKPDAPRRRTLLVEVADSAAAVPVDDAREVVRLEASLLHDVRASTLPHAIGEMDWLGKLAPLVNLAGIVAELSAGGEATG